MIPTAIFFFSNIIIGNFMMLNLFLAILIKFVNDEHEEEHVKEGEDEKKSPEQQENNK